MNGISTYLTFNGNCREAVTFYAKCLKSDLEMMPFSEAQCDTPPEAKDRVMHARVGSGANTLMASDSFPGMDIQQGNNFSVCMNCDTREEIDSMFAALGENGKVTMPLQDTFWGAYFGMLTDQFGIQWMFNFDKAKQA